jgi:hypothetical protein
MAKQLHIGVLTGRTPYPNGMAGTQRIHLMARAMAEEAAAVKLRQSELAEFSFV